MTYYKKDINRDLLEKQPGSQIREVGFKDDHIFCQVKIPDRRKFKNSEVRQAVIALLKRSCKPMTPKQIAERLDYKRINIRMLLRNMLKSHDIYQLARGQYTSENPEQM